MDGTQIILIRIANREDPDKPEFFLLVDLREFFSDLGSGGRKKKNNEKSQ